MVGRPQLLRDIAVGTADVMRGVVAVAIGVGISVVVNLQASPRHHLGPLLLALTVLACCVAVIYRTVPVVAALTALAISLLGTLLGYTMAGALVVALVLVGMTCSRSGVRVTGPIGVLSGLCLAAVALVRADHDVFLASVGGFAVGMLPALAGERVRSIRGATRDAREIARRIEELRDRDVLRAVTQERLRIARDVHDITGHHLSAISLQAAGGGRASTDETARVAFGHIHRLAKQALDQTRGALGILREDDDAMALAPPPRVADLDTLLEPTRMAGLDVSLAAAGQVRELPETVDTCVYRVVQESLTNVLRHAQATTVQVTVDYGPTALKVTICDNGTAASKVSQRPGRPSGNGLVGMRDRVSLIGGELFAGARDDGSSGWIVRISVPMTNKEVDR